MHQNWLMRHGRAVDRHPDGDSARPLSDDGMRGIGKIARVISKFGWQPTEFWASPYVRTQMTSNEIHAVVGGARSERPDCTPHGVAEDVAAELLATQKDVWLVSHMPLLPAVVQSLTRSKVVLNFEPGSIAHIGVVNSNMTVLLGFYAASMMEAH